MRCIKTRCCILFADLGARILYFYIFLYFIFYYRPMLHNFLACNLIFCRTTCFITGLLCPRADPGLVNGRQGGRVWGGGAPLPNREGSGEGAEPPPQKLFWIFIPKWRIFVHSANDGGMPLWIRPWLCLKSIGKVEFWLPQNRNPKQRG